MRLLFLPEQAGHDALHRTEMDAVYLAWMWWFLKCLTCGQKYARLVQIALGLERGSYVSRKSLASPVICNLDDLKEGTEGTQRLYLSRRMQFSLPSSVPSDRGSWSQSIATEWCLCSWAVHSLGSHPWWSCCYVS